MYERDSYNLLIVHYCHFQGYPVSVLWYSFILIAMQVHIFTLIFAWKLILAWKNRGMAKKVQWWKSAFSEWMLLEHGVKIHCFCCFRVRIIIWRLYFLSLYFLSTLYKEILISAWSNHWKIFKSYFSKFTLW